MKDGHQRSHESTRTTYTASESSKMTNKTDFPVLDLVPKKETNALEFQTKHPAYDGRNVVIGILDTGVDPGAAGIRYMQDGITPKLIDLVDCTGSCDVDVSFEQDAHWVVPGDSSNDIAAAGTAQDDKLDDGCWQVQTLSGRTLKLSKDWKICPFPTTSTKTIAKSSTNTPLDDTTTASRMTPNSSDNPSPTSTTATCRVRLGLKRAYELFPEPLINRVKTHRKKQLDKDRDAYIATARKSLAEFKETTFSSSNGISSSNGGKTTTPEQIKQRDDLQAYIDLLSDDDTWNNDNDPGLLLDCVVFWDGRDYRAVIDPTESSSLSTNNKEDGDLRQACPMTDFRKERQFSTVSTVDQYNYGVNFYDDGTVLSIVGDITPHGTHVAGIASAADGERSGVAPGAQIISFKVGDSRLKAMETGTALVRGMMEAVRLGCDVINLSFGEGAQLPNHGRVMECAEELVRRHNIIFVSSAGNNGPALSSVNAPGGMTSCILGVGAYVSPDMMKAGYSLTSNTDNEGGIIVREESLGVAASDSLGSDHETSTLADADCEDEELVGTIFTWSSAGPATDGFNGVSICAPGGAIAPVSNWTMQKSMLMSGTSMSSPHACGCVALLISACKAEGIQISPPGIKRALENTAKSIPNLSFPQQGWGMIQVDKAFEYLKACKDMNYNDVHFDVVVDSRPGNGSPRGIYLRQAPESSVRQTFNIHVNPNFKRDDDNDDTLRDEAQRYRIQFEMKFVLQCTESWASSPDHLILMNNGRSFKVSVDPTNLPPGVHTAKVLGMDADHPERGAVWHLPITVVKPMIERRVVPLGELELRAAEVKRFFVVPPFGSTWMDVTVRDCRDATKDGDSSVRLLVLHTLQVVPHADYRNFSQLKYINMLPSKTSVFSIPIEDSITCEVDIGRYWSTAGTTKVGVSIVFRGIRPVPSIVSMNCGDGGAMVRIHSDLADEDVSPSAKLNAWKTPLRPKSLGAISVLGERDIQPWNGKKTYQLILTYEFTQDDKGSFTARAPLLQGMLYDSIFESQIMMVYDGDKRFLGCSDAYPQAIAAPKGPVVIRMQVRHGNPAMLEKLTDMVLWVERKLDKEIALSAYEMRETMIVGKRTMKRRTIRKGQCASVFFSEPPQSKIPQMCKSGDILIGTAFYASGESTLPGQGKRPSGFPITYTVGPKMDKTLSSDAVEASEPKDERTAEEKMFEAIRDVNVEQLGKLTSSEKEMGKFEALFVALEKEYPGHLPLLMAHLKHIEGHKNRSEKLPELVEAADKVIAMISEDELAMHFGKKVDKEDPHQVKANKEMEKNKSFLIEALARKALAVSEMTTSCDSALFEEVVRKLKIWVDIEANGKYAALVVERDCRAGMYGLALKRINKLLSKPTKEGNGTIKALSKSDLLARRAQIFEKLGFLALVQREKSMRLVAAPKAYLPF